MLRGSPSREQRTPTGPRTFFSLTADCFLVKGSKRGALYDLRTGEIYSIDPVAVRVVEGCEAAMPVEEITKRANGPKPEDIYDFLRRAEDAGLGAFGAHPSEVPKYDLRRRYDTLDFVWFELREDCNLRCRHCYCTSQSRTGVRDRLTFEEWRRLLEEAFGLGCRAVQFIGGEPFLYGDRLFQLAGHARALGYQSVGVFSNLTFLKDEWIDKLLALRMDVACSLYSRRPEIHDLVTTIPGSFHRTMRCVRRLQERGIQPRFCVTVMKQNQDYIEETMDFLREMGMKDPGFDLVRPSGRGNDAELIPDKLSKKRGYRAKAEFMRTDRETFVRRFNGNGCWQGKIAVSSTGDVNPCIMQRDAPAANARQASLKKIVAGPLRKFWDLSFDKIEICRDCEYRYACQDCRPITYGPTGELTARSAHCSYDPYRGEFIDADEAPATAGRTEPVGRHRGIEEKPTSASPLPIRSGGGDSGRPGKEVNHARAEESLSAV